MPLNTVQKHTYNIESYNVSSVPCKISSFPRGENGGTFLRLSDARRASTNLAGVLLTPAQLSTVSRLRSTGPSVGV